MSRDLEKVHETDDEIRFAYPHRGAWIGAAFGVAVAAAGFLAVDGGGGVALGLFGVLLTWAGVSSALYRMELAFDLRSRTYRYVRGQVHALERGEGTFDDVEAVVLKKELERRGSDEVDEWEVELVMRGWPRPIEVAETKDEEPARREAERLAARLGVEMRERTGY